MPGRRPTRGGSHGLCSFPELTTASVKREIEKRPEIEVRHQSDSGAFALEPDSRRPLLPLGDLEPEPVEDVPVSYPKRPLRRLPGVEESPVKQPEEPTPGLEPGSP